MSDTSAARTALHPDEALALVESWNEAPELETVSLDRALGRALARELPALMDQPPFDKSAMDGFAYAAAADTAGPDFAWRVAAILPAGAGRSLAPLGPGECARIMTGAPLPPGADRVQRIEWTTEEPGGLVRFTKPESETNVILRAENQRAGDRLLSPRMLAPVDIGLLASSGYAELPVARRPRVAVLSTGDELAAPGGELRDGAIFDSNGPQLAAQARAAGCDARYLGSVRDKPGALDLAVAVALESCDVLLLSGGVSMGDFDYVPRALAAAGVRQVYHGLAMRPGKPSYFGLREGRAVFGLPGNPVSTFVNFEVLVKPHLYRRMGLLHKPRLVSALLARGISRKGSDRVEFLPARLERTEAGAAPRVRPLPYHGSSMLSVFAEADCLLRVELGVTAIEEGSWIDARLLRP